jgi:glutamine amidotransferase
VHHSLVAEKNSLRCQSREHKDGWGIAYYDQAAPQVAHGIGAAHADPEFERVSNLVSSHAVIAHVRLASVGVVHLRNAHPFLFERWAFCHNGTVRNFDAHRAAFEAEMAPRFRSLLRGDTDSERCFYLFLTRLETYGGLVSPGIDAVARSLAEVMQLVKARTDVPDKPSSTNFLVTDGELMVATRRNRSLFLSELHGRQPPGHPAPKDGDRLSQFVVSSEELSAENHWHEVPEETLLGVTPDLTLRTWTMDGLTPRG